MAASGPLAARGSRDAQTALVAVQACLCEAAPLSIAPVRGLGRAWSQPRTWPLTLHWRSPCQCLLPLQGCWTLSLLLCPLPRKQQLRRDEMAEAG